MIPDRRLAGGCRDFNGPFPQSLVMSTPSLGGASHDAHIESTMWSHRVRGAASAAVASVGSAAASEAAEQVDHSCGPVDDHVGEPHQVGLLVRRRADDEAG